MEAREFLQKLDTEAIVAAIRQAEEKTSGHIQVFISRKDPRDAVRTAQRRFLKLGLDETKARNAVLFYIAPRARKIAFLGDKAFNEQCGGEGFWRDITREVSGYFRKQEYTEGVMHAVKKIGQIYVEHFPAA